MSTLLTAPSTTFGAQDIRTASEPPEYRGLTRDGVRLLVADGAGITHTSFTDLPSYLRSGDVLVVNDSATLPAEVDGRRSSGRPVVVHLATDLGDGRWVAELRSAPAAAAPVLDGEPGEAVHLPGRARLRLLEPYPRPGSGPTGSGSRLWRVRVHGIRAVLPYLHRYGRPIAYGYLGRRFPLTDYQTIFGVRPGSAEMPSAGRPFTTDLVSRLETGGVAVVPVTLHTGVSSQDAGEAPQAEWFDVPEPTAAHVRAAHDAGARVIAVGTTVTRALESAATPDGSITAAAGWTTLTIDPSRGVAVVDGLITGWHHPNASHLLLVEAVAGPELTQRAYDAAIALRYRWHEFGDAGLLLRR